jgi:hypothetical protein
MIMKRASAELSYAPGPGASNSLADFFKYNNSKNYIINNKSEKNKILNIPMTTHHCQWRGANAPLSVASLLKRDTGSGTFVSYKYQLCRYLSVRVFIKPVFRQRATGSGAFTQRRHCFKILLLSLLLLII